MITCIYCGLLESQFTISGVDNPCLKNKNGHDFQYEKKVNKKKRTPMERLHIPFIEAMILIGELGQIQHGDHHYQDMEKRPEGRSIIQHLYKHLNDYEIQLPYSQDKIFSKKYHLAAVAFNAMMEFYWFEKENER